MSLAIVLSLAAAAAAADPTDAIEKPHRLAACLVRASPNEVRALLDIDPRTPVFGTRLGTLVNGHGQGCKKKAKNMTVGLGVFAGVLAEALLRARFQPDVPVEQLAPNPNRRAIPVRNSSETVAFCTLAKAPSASSKLIATPPGSAAEGRALDGLRPVITSCVPQGRPINAGAPLLRSIISLAAWRTIAAERTR